ncbi:hypothetical protein [Hyphobacterium sp. CCMP332]|nr:hypothetical protein [Hyphobacterium sp. CCMP332]
MAETEYDDIRQRLDTPMHERGAAFEAALDGAGAPWTPTRMLPPL